MQFPEQSAYLVDESFTGVEENVYLEFKWFPIDFDVLQNLPLLPAFLQHSLKDLPSSVEHIVEHG